METQPDQEVNKDEKLNKSDSDKTGGSSESSTDNALINSKEKVESKTDLSVPTLNDANKLKLIKDLCKRTDLGAIAKVDNILLIIDPEQEKQNPLLAQKRPLQDQNLKENSKQFKGAADIDDAGPEDVDVDSCVVCGLSLRVFKEDAMKEMHHYLSHGFRVLKEFEILKPDDSFFLMCNICDR